MKVQNEDPLGFYGEVEYAIGGTFCQPCSSQLANAEIARAESLGCTVKRSGATHCKRCGARFKPGEPDIQFVKDETGDCGGYFHRPCLKSDLRLEILASYPPHAPGDSGAA